MSEEGRRAAPLARHGEEERYADLWSETSYPYWGVLGFAALVATLSILVVFAHSRDQLLRSAERDAANIARMLEGYLAAVLSRVDAELAGLATEMDAAPSTREPGAPYWHAVLRRQANRFPEVEGYHVFDARGEVLHSSTVNVEPVSVAHREYFRRLRDTSAVLVISDTIDSRGSGRSVIAVARGLYDERSRFRGAVSGLIDLGVLRAFVHTLDTETQDVILLRRRDNHAMLMRHPDAPAEINRRLSSPLTRRIDSGDTDGVIHVTSPIDGRRRIFGFRVVHGYPLYVGVGLSEERVLAPWYERLRGAVALEVIGLLALAGLLYRLLRAEKRRAYFAVELLRNQESLQQMQAAAERASQAKSEFLSRMSHELRTPLNAIIGFAQMLEHPGRSPLAADQAECVREIRVAGEHLLFQVNEVLDLARIESGRIDIVPTIVELVGLIEEALALVAPLAVHKEVQVVWTPPSLALFARADRQRLRQVLLNLFSNAIKYNRQGGRMEVRAQTQGEGLRLTVADTGRGIGAEALSHLFQPFERVGAIRDSVEGTGIGLALVKKLVEAMEGTIGVRSELGIGSEFWVDLPRAKPPAASKLGAGEAAPASAAALPAAQSKTAAVNAPAGDLRHLLYIEDNPVNVRLMRKLLECDSRYRLAEAGDGAAGLAAVGAKPPDLILLDISLPDIDGFEVMRRLAAMEAARGIPVVAVTANALPQDIERGKALGFADYVTKPVDIDRLLAIIDRHLCRPSRHEPTTPE